MIRGKDKVTGKTVAIKLIKNIFKCVYQARLAYREIFILRKLSEINENIYTTKLIDIIFPKWFGDPDPDDVEQRENMNA